MSTPCGVQQCHKLSSFPLLLILLCLSFLLLSSSQAAIHDGSDSTNTNNIQNNDRSSKKKKNDKVGNIHVVFFSAGLGLKLFLNLPIIKS